MSSTNRNTNTSLFQPLEFQSCTTGLPSTLAFLSSTAVKQHFHGKQIYVKTRNLAVEGKNMKNMILEVELFCYHHYSFSRMKYFHLLIAPIKGFIYLIG